MPSRVLLGVEADVSFPEFFENGLIAGLGTAEGTAVTDQVDYVATLRGRLGYAVGHWLIYATGGFAWSQARFGETPGLLADEDRVLRTRTGWTAGMGAEVAIAADWTARLEYFYYSFGNVAGTFPSGTAYQSAFDIQTLRLGLNRQLDWGNAGSAGGWTSDQRLLASGDWNVHGQFTFIGQAVMVFEDFLDAKRVLGVLGRRFARYGLSLHPDKTRFVDFRSNRPDGTNHPETDGTSFTFLGFAHIWGKSRVGKNVVRQVTAKNRYARALAAVTAWCRVNRHQPIPDQQAHLIAMMRGHYAYYGITGNFRRLRWYADQVERIWQKWLSRRDRGSRLLWSRFTALLKRHPLPAARIVHRYTFASKTLP